MNRNLFFKELSRNLVSLVIWTAAITFLISVTMSVYPTFYTNQTKILGFFNLVPKTALQFKGISNFSDLFSVLGFYAANNVIYMMVLGSIFAIVLSSNILLKEEYNKTAEYLLTRPVTRSEIFISKLMVVLLQVFVLNLVTSIAGYTGMEIVKKDPFNIRAFLVLSVYTFLLNLLFGAAGLFISVLVKRAKPITTFSIGLVLILYFIHTIARITEGASKIGYISPFRYVDLNVLAAGYRLDPWKLLYFTGISLFLGILAYRLYLRKDIYT